MPVSIAEALTDTALARWINNDPAIWPVLESLHFVGLCVLFGGVIVVDLWLLGYFKPLAPRAIRHLTVLALSGFAINLATGILFFVGNTFKYLDNPAFTLKLVLILIAGVNALWFRFYLAQSPREEHVTRSGAAIGIISLLAWCGVIVCGRMITFYA